MDLTGIYRASSFSPNQHGHNDQLILEKTARRLADLGCRVRLISEEEVGDGAAVEDEVIFSMCQGPKANDRLERLQRQGVLIINSPAAVKGCYRQNLYRPGAHPGRGGWMLPPTHLLSSASPGDIDALWGDAGSYWLKRGDVHSTQEGDVLQVGSPRACRAALADMARRGIRAAALQRDMPGQVIKFYGVRGSDFFRFYAEQDHDLHPAAFPAARPRIEELVAGVGLEIYGGDAVLGADGSVAVIDVNDWPSYAYFRDEAARAIADRVFELSLARRQEIPCAAPTDSPRTGLAHR